MIVRMVEKHMERSSANVRTERDLHHSLNLSGAVAIHEPEHHKALVCAWISTYLQVLSLSSFRQVVNVLCMPQSPCVHVSCML